MLEKCSRRYFDGRSPVAMKVYSFLLFILQFIVSSIIMDSQTIEVINNLRDSVEKYRREIWSLRESLKDERNNVDGLKQKLNDSSKNNASLVRCNETLKNQLAVEKEKNIPRNPLVVTKTFDNLISPRGRQIRKRKYKKILDEAVGCITECKRAKMTLGFEKGHVDIIWNEGGYA